MNLIETLKKEGIYEFIMNIKDEKNRNRVLSECRIENFKKGNFIHFIPESETLAMAFLKGRVNLIVYLDDIIDYTVTWESNMWFGIAQALSEDLSECDIVFLEDSKVLFFPLQKILFEDPKENIDLWIKICKMSARKALRVQRKVIERGALSTEAYFLKYLSENGYSVEGVSIQDISYELNIKTRTLQRVIQLLEEEGYIKRDQKKKSIYTVDKKGVDTYLENIAKE